MSNTPNLVIDFSIPIDTWGAASIGDGTWSDVVGSLKKDQAGLEADATAIPEAAGEIWANMMDDFLIAVYRVSAGAEKLGTSTGDATPSPVKTLASLADGDAYRVEFEFSASDGVVKFLDGSKSGLACKFGGVISLIHTDGTTARVGFVTADAAIDFSDNTNLVLTVTGEAATTIRWTIKVVRVERIPGP